MSDGVGIGGMIAYLREKKSLWLVAAALVTGICLMLSGGVGTGGADASDVEERVENLCERVDGASDVTVMITYDNAGECVRGVAVVCTGGDDANVQLVLTEMLCALFGIPSSSVSVVGGK